MHIQHFPYEVLVNIFRFSISDEDRKNARICAQVCRSWHPPACRILYEEVRLDHPNILLESLIYQKTQLGRFCRVLKIKGYIGIDYTELFQRLPNLETIILNRPGLANHLEKIEERSRFLPHIKEISIAEDRCVGLELQANHQCLTAFNKVISNLKLVSLNKSICSSKNVIPFLSSFISLTSLEIKSLDYDITTHRYSMCFILHSLPNLLKFTLNSILQESDRDAQTYISTNSKLRYLEIKLHDLSTHYIKFLVSCITRLKQLNLSVVPWTYRSNGTQWMETVNSDSLNRLQNYLKSIEEVKIVVSNKTSLTKYWSFISGVATNHQPITPIQISLTANDTKCDEDGGLLLLQKGSGIVNIKFRGGPQTSSLVTGLLASPVLSELKENSIQSFHAHFEDYCNRKQDPNTLYLEMFQNILTCFPNMQKFRLNMDAKSYSFDEFNGKKASSSQHNNARDGRYISIQPIVSSEKLSRVTLRNIKSTEDITKVLLMLPNTSHLKLLNCVLTPDEKFNYVVDLSHLYLQQLEVDMTKIAYTSGKITVVLRIEALFYISCYKWSRESMQFNALNFKCIDNTYLDKYGRYKSPYFHVITIKCHTLDHIRLFIRHPHTSEIMEAILELKE